MWTAVTCPVIHYVVVILSKEKPIKQTLHIHTFKILCRWTRLHLCWAYLGHVRSLLSLLQVKKNRDCALFKDSQPIIVQYLATVGAAQWDIVASGTMGREISCLSGLCEDNHCLMETRTMEMKYKGPRYVWPKLFIFGDRSKSIRDHLSPSEVMSSRVYLVRKAPFTSQLISVSLDKAFGRCSCSK